MSQNPPLLNNKWRKSWINSLVWLNCFLGIATPSFAQIQGNSMTNINNANSLPPMSWQPDPTVSSMSKVPSVSQLRDVEPTQWAYQALRSLVERYGCLVGWGAELVPHYPNNLYRGDMALTRWEFAAALNNCLNSLETQLQNNLTVSREDLETFKRLSEEFKQELAILDTKLDNLENRVAFLEDHQFSTTTKLFTQIIWSVDDTFGNKVGTDEDQSQTRFGYRIRLNLETSFNGQDLLRTRLQVGDLIPTSEVTGTNMTRFNYDDDSNNQVFATHLLYRRLLTNNLQLTVGPVGVGYTDITDTLTPPSIPDDSRGIPSRFGEYNPLYRRGGGGGALNWNILGLIEGASIGPSDPNAHDLILTIGYLSTNINNTIAGNGFFNEGYHVLAQLAYYVPGAGVGLAYSHTYGPAGQVDLTGDNGTLNAIQPFGNNIATSSDSYNLQGYVRLGDNFFIHGWIGYYQANANSKGISNISDGVGGTIPLTVSKGDEADFWNAAISFTFPDIGGEGNLPGILLGIPPTVSHSDLKRDCNTPYHIEVFYRWQLNDHIAITPGFWAILNPEGDNRNDTQWVGHIRTGFNF
ncbi:iron uptake porin [Gloeothece verrucosa]|uniref:Carbohydrate-selective porin OprB n=1 Tax=Gloeothece verrucosa (strain PCC 7822) TaxID=497965 RepID=E0ULG4_GLOV7|nr:iron uptake porin [Gloeothece verrucosa]ADN17794.1 Carbohydrate-selective porin OprB [Gloeothece verrucosa PCC 7822]